MRISAHTHEPFPNLYASVLASLIFVADELDTFMKNVLSFGSSVLKEK